MPFTTFLTKFPAHEALNRTAIEKKDREKQWNIDDPEFRHRAVMGLFPHFDGENVRSQSNILFRYEFVPGQPPYFLVQSDVPVVAPDLEGRIQTKQIEIGDYAAGEPVAFRLSLNTVTRHEVDNAAGKKVSKVVPVPLAPINVESGLNPAEEFAAGRLQQALVDIEFLNLNRHVLGVNRRGRLPQGSKVVQVDTFDGVGFVNDPVELEKMLRHGLGRSKAYGCGLLTVKRV
ncbi:MAG: type I-E CRISPR-associated protein Cas6/Cse3/CasE [Corynebacterium sp.]|uniref:type I-E CRISPR-associated protein Cas6/Cse3/CasE n=1 Tax=Corynebacterium sp. TaxID=1720 RepID=UPI0026DCC3CD|nr:type I-E CRISPR-associated protein Cas6/Cse3/CasE [Corynebacterium sp.]MDO4762324.1 type I-E CRISPR-associated protein Cas6/Cse3/CasE [Corynebacterium sp.]